LRKKNGDFGTALPNSLACSLKKLALIKVQTVLQASGTQLLTSSCDQLQQFCDQC
jgi:hypothetical protein